MIAGVDEVGRGCLAGPVIAASVIVKRPIKGLMDSKKLSSKKREDLSQVIIENSDKDKNSFAALTSTEYLIFESFKYELICSRSSSFTAGMRKCVFLFKPS